MNGITCFIDISIKTCSQCSKFKENRDFLYELLGEEFGGEWVDSQRLGIIYSLLEVLKNSKTKLLSHEDKISLNEILLSA
ncbi:hypothetical protein KKG48_03070 [Patescibacteria group bacterium]|nr:hypothetical protein [Patescibacteria group bacterium]